MERVWGRGEAYTGFWWGKTEEKRPLGRPRLEWEEILRWIFKK